MNAATQKKGHLVVVQRCRQHLQNMAALVKVDNASISIKHSECLGREITGIVGSATRAANHMREA